VSVVRFHNSEKEGLCVTASWDKTIKVWNTLYMSLKYTFIGHKAQITTLDIVDKSSYLASGSHDGSIMVWDIANGKCYTKEDCNTPVNSVLFSQKLYWLIIATETGIKVYFLPKNKYVQEDLVAHSMIANERGSKKLLACKSLAWSKSGNVLYSGWSDNHIRVYEIEDKSSGDDKGADKE